jgi:hypothetical protein
MKNRGLVLIAIAWLVTILDFAMYMMPESIRPINGLNAGLALPVTVVAVPLLAVGIGLTVKALTSSGGVPANLARNLTILVLGLVLLLWHWPMFGVMVAKLMISAWQAVF